MKLSALAAVVLALFGLPAFGSQSLDKAATDLEWVDCGIAKKLSADKLVQIFKGPFGIAYHDKNFGCNTDEMGNVPDGAKVVSDPYIVTVQTSGAGTGGGIVQPFETPVVTYPDDDPFGGDPTPACYCRSEVLAALDRELLSDGIDLFHAYGFNRPATVEFQNNVMINSRSGTENLLQKEITTGDPVLDSYLKNLGRKGTSKTDFTDIMSGEKSLDKTGPVYNDSGSPLRIPDLTIPNMRQ